RGSVLSLGYSPGGGLLASGSTDTTVLLWDQSGRFLAGGPLQRVDDVWADLASARGEKGFRAVGALAASPEAAVKLLKGRLRPAAGKARGPEEIRKLIDDLDAARYQVREKANRELERLGVLAGPALRERIKGSITAELRRRIELLLHRLDQGIPSPEELR